MAHPVYPLLEAAYDVSHRAHLLADLHEVFTKSSSFPLHHVEVLFYRTTHC
jgi:hypothetical protein